MKFKSRNKIGQPVGKIIVTLLVIFFLINMIISPAKYITKSLDGITAWAFNVLPSVLPFMFFTRVLSALDVMPQITQPFSKISTRVFHTPPISVYTFVMAILSGYPVGSKMVADLYLQGKITKEEAYKMTSFCSTSGPMFIIGAVGIGMFRSAQIGYILFISHVIGAILNGILYRNYKIEDNEKRDKNIENAQNNLDISQIVTNSTLSILSVGCIITIFFIVIETLSPILNLFPSNITAFLEGVIEITKGCISLSALPNKFIATSLCSFVISFGGISTVLQSLTMLSNLKMPVRLFVKQKITHAFLSTLVTILLLILI